MPVNLKIYKPDAAETALIEKYNFSVSERDNHFVVKHPGHKKLGTFTGGNLYLLLCDAERATIKLETFRATKVKATMKTTSKQPEPIQLDSPPVTEDLNAPEIDGEALETQESVPPVVGEAETETAIVASPERIHVCPDEPGWCEEYNDKLHQQSLETPPETISGVVLDDSGGKVRKPKKEKGPKRDPSKLKFLSAFKLWLVYPDKEPKFVRDKLIKQGIDAKDSSVEMLRHMCSNVIRAMVELGFTTHVEMKARRTVLVEQNNIPGLGDILQKALEAKAKEE